MWVRSPCQPRKSRSRVSVSFDVACHVLHLRNNSIIAVHGLGSDPEKSWVWKAHSNEEKKVVKSGLQVDEVNWLTDLLPNDLPKARVLAFNYESRCWGEGQSQRIQTCARLMLSALQTANYEVRRALLYIHFTFHLINYLQGKRRLSPYDICGT